MNTPNVLIKTDINPATKEGRIHVFRPDHIDDQALWNSFRSGDEQAFVIIFDRNVKPLYNYGMKIIADGDLVKDTVQNLFIELWNYGRIIKIWEKQTPLSFIYTRVSEENSFVRNPNKRIDYL